LIHGVHPQPVVSRVTTASKTIDTTIVEIQASLPSSL
jgi:hypothetical protein